MSLSQACCNRISLDAATPFFFLAACALMLGGCAYIPSDGPLKRDVESESRSQDTNHPFELVDVSDSAIQVLNQYDGASLAKSFGDTAPPPELPIGRGDVLAVSIWEAGNQPLFATPLSSGQQTAGAHAAVLPEQAVGSDGCISIPFAGRIPVAGRNLAQIQNDIEAALSGKAAKAQVLVSLARNMSATVTVVGEAAAGGHIPLSTHGDRLLDVLAAAGGSRAPSYETWIGLTRDGVTSSVPLVQVMADSRENVFLRPGDILNVARQPETYTVLGAVGHNAQINFETAHLTLIQAVAKAGGLLDQRSDPRGVFLFRQEPAAIANALAGKPAGTANAETVPVIYRLDMTRVDSYFLAGNFAVRDGDMLYVASAPANELQKFLQLLGLVTQPVVEGAVLNSALK